MKGIYYIMIILLLVTVFVLIDVFVGLLIIKNDNADELLIYTTSDGKEISCQKKFIKSCECENKTLDDIVFGGRYNNEPINIGGECVQYFKFLKSYTYKYAGLFFGLYNGLGGIGLIILIIWIVAIWNYYRKYDPIDYLTVSREKFVCNGCQMTINSGEKLYDRCGCNFNKLCFLCYENNRNCPCCNRKLLKN